MTGLRAKLSYLMWCAGKQVGMQPRRCPACQDKNNLLVQRKYLVSELRQCKECGLLFRYPVDSEKDNHDFYQADYAQGFTTDCPGETELAALLESRFQGHEKDYSGIIATLRSLGLPAGSSVLDYGCSWGYGSWQLQQAGFKVQAYEISLPRARYAREKLGIDVTSDIASLRPGVDCFFSSHVLEHVPSITKVIRFAESVLKPGGLFVALTPNGSAPYRNRDPRNFRLAWGKVHPNYLSDEYYLKIFANRPLLLASPPYSQEAIASWQRSGRTVLDLSGAELLCVAAMS